MGQNDFAIGLDIGTTKIVAMIGRYNEYGKMEVLGIGKSKSLGVHRGVVNNITQTIQSIQHAVQEAQSVANVKIEEVTVGIAGQHIRSLQHSDYITRPHADEVIDDSDIDTLCNQVHKLVMLPGEEILHVLPQEYKVDGQSEIKGSAEFCTAVLEEVGVAVVPGVAFGDDAAFRFSICEAEKVILGGLEKIKTFCKKRLG